MAEEEMKSEPAGAYDVKEEKVLLSSMPDMESPRLNPTPAPVDRTIARLIDFLIAAVLFEFPAVVGPLAALTYILISDGLFGGRSVGKRMVGLRVVSTARGGAPCDFKDSIIRNAVFGIVVIIFFIVGWVPYLGSLVVIVVWAVIVGYEMMLVFNRPSGSRFGDRIADTRVECVGFEVDFKDK